MNIATSTFGSVTVLAVDDRLTVEAELGKVQDAVRHLVGRGKKYIILNLNQVHSLDCAGIGVLVTVYRAVRENGGELALASMRERPRRLLEMAGLLTVIRAFDNERQAVVGLQAVEQPGTSSPRRSTQLRSLAPQAG